MRFNLMALGVAGVLAAAMPASAGVFFSEWMYDGSEFIEITNTGPTAVDVSGYSFDDSTQIPGSLGLASFGTLAVGEAAIISQDPVAGFRSLWGLPDTVKVIQNNAADVLQRSDELNLYNAAGTLVDRLTYNDQGTGTVDSPRTQNSSGNVAPANFGANNASLATLSVAGDAFGSYAVVSNATTLVANPGNVPEPAGLATLAAVGAAALRRRRVAQAV